MKTKGNKWAPTLLIFAQFLVMSAGAATVNIELPKWDVDADVAPYYPGGGLWPDGTLPEGGLAYIKGISIPAVEEKMAHKPTATEYVILKEEKKPPIENLIDPEMADELPPIENELKERYFAKVPVRPLIDPQGLITEQKANDILRFLELHAEESDIQIYTVVFGKHQKIPDDVDLEQQRKAWFGDKPVILAAYHIREPDTLQLHFNETISERLPALVVTKICNSCIEEAKLADNGADQLERIVIELSIQTFWLEKLLQQKSLPPGMELTSLEHAAKSLLTVAKPDPVSRPAELDSIVQEIKRKVEATVSPKLVKTIVAGSSAILILALILFIRGAFVQRRSLKNEPVLFPSYHQQTRLGGEFTGGTFVGVSYELGRTDGRIDI